MYTTYYESRDNITVKVRSAEKMFEYIELAARYPANYPSELMHRLLHISDWFFTNPYVVYCPGMVSPQMHNIIDYPDTSPASLDEIERRFRVIYDELLEDKEYALVKHIHVTGDMVRLSFFDLPTVRQEFLQLESRLHAEQRKYLLDATLADLCGTIYRRTL